MAKQLDRMIAGKWRLAGASGDGGMIGLLAHAGPDGLHANQIARALGQSLAPGKAFLDPSEVAVTSRRGPLLVPILDKLNTNIDEPGPEFSNATDIRDTSLQELRDHIGKEGAIGFVLGMCIARSTSR